MKLLIQQATHAIAPEAFDRKVVLARATDLQLLRPVNAAAMMASSRRLNLSTPLLWPFRHYRLSGIIAGTALAAA